ncbi:MAG: hypothetical protein NTV32_07360 [Gammaproteobacteria bacterium]|jgi:hypothetical protein|nr:hypothetical protein [Gammaproteobacteria bacterium]
MTSLKIQYGDLEVKSFFYEKRYILKYKLLSENEEKYRFFDKSRPFVFIPDISALRHVSTVSAVFYSGKECKGFIMQPVPVEMGPVSVAVSYDGSTPVIRPKILRSLASENTMMSALTRPFWEVLAHASEQTPRPREMSITSFGRAMANAEGLPLAEVLAK